MAVRSINWFQRVSEGYTFGYYDNVDVATFVLKGRITVEQYEQITGEPFKAE